MAGARGGGQRHGLPDQAAALRTVVACLVDELEQLGATVLQGRFGADMQVASVNDGPVTIWIDTDNWD